MPDLDSPYALDDSLARRYRADGYIKLKNVLSASELATYGASVTQVVRSLTPDRRLAQIEGLLRDPHSRLIADWTPALIRFKSRDT